MAEDKITIRTPDGEDVARAAVDLLTLRSGPPLVVALAIVFFLLGSIVAAVIGVGVTGYLLSLWARLERPRPPQRVVDVPAAPPPSSGIE